MIPPQFVAIANFLFVKLFLNNYGTVSIFYDIFVDSLNDPKVHLY